MSLQVAIRYSRANSTYRQHRREQAYALIHATDFGADDMSAGAGDLAELRQMLHNEDMYFAMVGDKVVGTLCRQRFPGSPGTEFLSGVAVLPEYRNQGVATKLLYAVLCDMQPGTKVTLYAYPHNHSFWLRMGFEKRTNNLFRLYRKKARKGQKLLAVAPRS